MEKPGLISVILSCHNYGRFVGDAINSVLNQTYPNFELIIINDGSTDDSDGVIKSFLPHPFIRYINQKNCGQTITKNRGISLAKGEFVAFIDADDVWRETKLEKQIRLFKTNDVGVVYSPLKFIDEEGNNYNKKWEGFFLGTYRGKVTDKLFLRNFVPFSSSVVRKSCFEKIETFDETLPMGIDWDLWLRLSTSYTFDYVKEPLLLYRIGHSNQMSGNICLRHKCSDRIMQKFLQHYSAAVSPAIVKKAEGFTYYNRARQLYETDKNLSNSFYLKAIRYPSFTLASLKGLAKNSMSAFDAKKYLNNSRGSIQLPGGQKKREERRIGIAFVIDTIRCDTEGTQRQLLEMIRRLDTKRFRPLLVCLWHSPWMSSHTLPCESVVLNFRGFLKKNVISTFISFRKIVRTFDIEIVQAYFEDSRFFTFFSTCFMADKPQLLASRRDTGLDKKRPWYHRIYNWLYPYVNRGFDAVLVNSHQGASFVMKLEKVPEEKIKIIYNGIQLNKNIQENPFNHSPADEIRIGLVASLTPVKRIDTFIHALAALIDRVPQIPVRGVIIGEGRERAALENLRKNLGLEGRIVFTGAVTNVPAYLKQLHIGVNCSEREGLSNAVLEYMAYGLPVIATDVGGNGELVNLDRGVLIEVGNTQQAMHAMADMVCDTKLRETLGRNAREFVRRNFSWDRSMQELQQVYEMMIDKRERGERKLWQYPQSQH